MAGRVNISRALGAPTIPADADFNVCVVGYASDSPVAVGLVTPLYSSPEALSVDLGLGDAVDCAYQAIAPTAGNPAPPGVAMCPTPATTPGVRGAITQTGITGTAVVAATASTHPLGTYEPMGRVVVGGTIGSAGIVLQFSLDNGRSWLASQALGTATTIKVLDQGIETGVQYDVSPASADLTALNTLINEIYGDQNAHVILTTGTVHGSADTGNVVTIASASDTETRVARVNALRLAYIAHINTGSTVHLTEDATNVLVRGAATDDSTALLLALDLKAKLNLHDASTTVHGIADATNTVTSPSPSMGVFVAGDSWYEAKTTPPMWAAADLYTAGATPTGAFAAIAKCAESFGLVAITEPVAAGDFDEIVAGRNYCAAFNKRPHVRIRFRDPIAGESDADYIAAFQAFAALCQDARISCVAGSGWLTDIRSGRRYLRSGLPAVLAREQSFQARGGERLAHHPGFGGDGPLEHFTIVDDAGNLIGHDESARAGIDGPMAGGTGGGITFLYQRGAGVRGTYVSETPVLYPALSKVLTVMDDRVSSGIERELYAVAWTMIQGADIVRNGTLDSDAADAMSQAMRAAILAKFANEISNPDDPNLVTVNPAVVVDGSTYTLSVSVNDELFLYLGTINITVQNNRS